MTRGVGFVFCSNAAPTLPASLFARHVNTDILLHYFLYQSPPAPSCRRAGSRATRVESSPPSWTGKCTPVLTEAVERLTQKRRLQDQVTCSGGYFCAKRCITPACWACVLVPYFVRVVLSAESRACNCCANAFVHFCLFYVLFLAGVGEGVVTARLVRRCDRGNGLACVAARGRQGEWRRFRDWVARV